MIDSLIPQIEALRAEGAVVVLKWDGERSDKRCTVVVSRQETNYMWRRDTDEMEQALLDALSEYRVQHAK